MSTITVTQRLRPIRIACAIQAGNRSELRNAFAVDTHLWGGRYNSMLPFWTRRPAFRRHGPLSGPRLAGTYLDGFEPDFVVCERAERFHDRLDAAQIQSAREMLKYPQNPFVGIGAFQVYQWRYETDLHGSDDIVDLDDLHDGRSEASNTTSTPVRKRVR